MAYQSLEDIIKLCEEKDIPFWEAILQDDINERTIPVEESYDKMREKMCIRDRYGSIPLDFSGNIAYRHSDNQRKSNGDNGV